MSQLKTFESFMFQQKVPQPIRHSLMVSIFVLLATLLICLATTASWWWLGGAVVLLIGACLWGLRWGSKRHGEALDEFDDYLKTLSQEELDRYLAHQRVSPTTKRRVEMFLLEQAGI